MDLRVEDMYLYNSRGVRTNILATFDIGVYDDDNDDRAIFYINKNMVLLSNTPASDGEVRLKIRFPFRNQKNKDIVRDIIFFRDGDLKKRLIIEALSQYRDLYEASKIA